MNTSFCVAAGRVAGSPRWMAALVLGALVVLAGCNFGASGSTSADGGFEAGGGHTPAALAAQPTLANFGTVSVGAQSSATMITVSNTGGSPSAALSATLSGPNAAQFGIDSDGCSGRTLGPGSLCTLRVHFAPSLAGAAAATLAVSDGAGLPASVALTGTGAAPGAISISPGTKDFGSVAVGATSASTVFTVSNGGQSPTAALTLALTGQNAAQFALGSDACTGKTLAGGASCTVAVTFAPTAAGTAMATLTASAAGLAGTATASLSGTAAPPGAFALSPTTYDFGSIAQGSTTAQQAFTVKNTGGTASGTASVTVGGANAADFAIASNGCTAAVPAGGTCSFALTFTPSSAGVETATVTVTAPAIAAVTATVTGAGLAPAALSINPATQSFDSVAQGSMGADVAFVVTNGGGVDTGPLTASLGGSAANQFGLGSDGCTGKTLAASGGTCKVNVHFAPTASGSLGSIQATLLVGGTPGGTASATLTGTSVQPAAIVVGSTALAFGAVVAGQASVDVPVVVTNMGGAATGVLTTALSGTNASDFVIGADGCAGQSLATGATCTISVHFAPSAASLGAEQALLAVSAEPGGSAMTSLTGTAVTQAALTIDPPSDTFGTVVQGATSADVTFTVVNSGGVPTGALTVSLGGMSGGQFALASDQCTGQTLAVNGACTVAVHFAPTLGTLGPQQATLLVSGMPGGSVPASLLGTAATPLGITPAKQDFGIAAFGSPTSPIPFTVTNTSAASVGPLTVALQGAQGAQFVLATDACTGATLAANATCTVNVVFSPTAGTTGSVSATLNVSAGMGTSQQATVSGTAVKSATLAVGSGTQTFGSVVQGQSSGDVPITVTNKGAVVTGTLKATLSGADPKQVAEFGLGSDTCTGTTLAAGASCSVYVHFAPGTSALGAAQATLTVAATPGGSPSVTLSGTAVTQAALGIAGSGSFGSIVQGSASSDVTFTVTNSGGVATGALTAAVTGSQATEFVVSSDGCTGQSLAATTGTCTVKAHFAPALGSLGTRQATLTVTGSPGGTAPATLVGTATTPLGVSPTSQTFPNAAYQSPSPPATFTVTNASASSVGPLTVALGGSAASQYQLSGGTCSGATLAGGGKATCTVSVVFAPAQGVTGTEPATLTVSSGANTSTQATLTGTAVNPASLTLTGNGSFGTIVQTQSSGDVGFVVTNTGGVSSGTLKASLGGTSAAQFGFGTDGCTGTALGAGATCTVYVHFAPAAGVTGTQSASLTVGGSPGGAPALALSGNAATQAALSISGNGGFGSIVQGSSSSDATFTVTNTGGVPTGTLSVSALSAPFAIGKDGCTGVALAASGATGSSCTITAHFAPPLGTLGTQTATLTVSGTPGGTAPASLTGTATTALSISPAKQGLGTVATGTQGPQTTFTVTNSSKSSVGPLNVGLQGTNPSQFLVSTKSSCIKATLAAGGTCVVFAGLAPTQALGNVSAILDVNAGTNTDTQAALSGVATTPASLTISPPAGFNGNFGTVFEGSASTPETFTVTNGGGVASGTISISTGNSDFVVSSNTCTTVAAGGSCTFAVTFQPSVSTGEGTVMTVSASPGGSPTFQLSGTGQVRTIPLSVVVFNGSCSGGFCSEQCAPITLNMNVAGAAFTVDAEGSSTSTGGTFTFPGESSVPAGSSVTVMYSPPPTGTLCTCSTDPNNIHAQCANWGCPLTFISQTVTAPVSATIYCLAPIP
jgi:hypothetical protein